MNKNAAVYEDWSREKGILEEEIRILNEQNDENKRVQETLLMALNSKTIKE